MRKNTGYYIAAAVGLAAAGFLLLPFLIATVPAPIVDSGRVFAGEIYRTVDQTKRVARGVALPYLAQYAVGNYVAGLPLQPDVKSRVLERVEGSEFVDEIVPFALMLQSLYIASADQEPDTFAAHIRETYDRTAGIPGMQHSLFSWDPPTATDSSGFGIDEALAAELLTFYDGLYVRSGSAVADNLECAGDALASRVASIKPTLQRLLEHVRADMAADSEIGHALDAIIVDEHRSETIAYSLIEFFDLMVCKHYRMFASRIARQTQLTSWLLSELEKANGGDLWEYLESEGSKRYGVLIVVDGLQGHLVEALASGKADHPFVDQIRQEMQPADDERLHQSLGFLDHLAERGYDDSNYLPFFKDLYQDSGAADAAHPTLIANVGVSTTPTISVRNLPITKTGAPVAGAGGTGVPNFHFVERNEDRAYYFFGNDALRLTDLTAAAGMRTLYQRLPDRSSFSCAAQYDDDANFGIDPFLNLALGEAIRDFGEILCFTALENRAENEREARSLRQELMGMRDRLGVSKPWYDLYGRFSAQTARTRAYQIIERLGRLEGEPLPELLLYYNPWPDHFAHFVGPFSDEIISPSGELARLDYWLGRLAEIYRKAGVYDHTLFGMAGDHGLAPVHRLESPTELVLEPLIASGIPLEIVKISSDEGEGPKLTHVMEPPSMHGFDVVVASTAGGNLMFDFFIDQDARWPEQPLESDLRRFRPIAGSPQNIDLIDAMLTGLGDTLEYLAVRETASNAATAAVNIHGPGGTGRVIRDGDRAYYRFENKDLLQTSTLTPYAVLSGADREAHARLHRRCVTEADQGNPSSWCQSEDWRLLTSYTSKPDSVVQIANLYNSDRAGTVNLFPALGVAYNSIVPGRHAGESFHEKDAFVGVWGRPVARDERVRTAVNGSVPVTIFAYLSGQTPVQGTDGWGFDPLTAQFEEDR